MVDITEPAPRTGWVFYLDTTHTALAPFSITADARTLLDFDSTDDRQTDYQGSPPHSFWDDTNNVFIPIDEGDEYTIRLQFRIEPSGMGASPFMVLEFETDDDPALTATGNVETVMEKTVVLARGVGLVSAITESAPLFVGAAFGKGRIYITSSHDAAIHEIALHVGRRHKV